MSTSSANLALTLAEDADVVDVDTHIAANFSVIDSKWSTPGTPADIVVGTPGTPGSSTVVARSDHVHRATVGTPVSVGTTNSSGSNTTVAASDHIHKLGDNTVPVAAIQADAVTEAKLDVIDSPADNEVLTYDSGTGRMEWQSAAAVASAVARAGDTMTGPLVMSNGLSNGIYAKDSSGSAKLLGGVDGSNNLFLGHSDAVGTFILCSGGNLFIHNGSGFYAAYHAGNISTAPGLVPVGGVIWFETLAELTAAGATWARYTAADGRLLVGAGTLFSQTFTQATDYGVNWTPSGSLGATAGSLDVAGTTDAAATVTNQYTAGTASASGIGHTHGSSGLSISGVPTLTNTGVAWLPPSRAGIWGRRIS